MVLHIEGHCTIAPYSQVKDLLLGAKYEGRLEVLGKLSTSECLLQNYSLIHKDVLLMNYWESVRILKGRWYLSYKNVLILITPDWIWCMWYEQGVDTSDTNRAMAVVIPKGRSCVSY